MAKKTQKKATDNDKLILEAQSRKLLGKKVRKLRHEGFIPAAVYGPDFKSQSIQVNMKDFLKTYKIAHETSIVFLKTDSQEIPVLIKNLQRHPLDQLILHVDFRKVDLKQKMLTSVPIKIVGVSPAVTQKGGVFLTHAENVQIEALPSDIPQNIEINISRLKEIGEEIKISELAKSNRYEIKEPADRVLVSIIAHKEESIIPETTAPVTQVTTEKTVEEEAVKEGEVKEEAIKEKASKEEQAKKEST